MNEKPGKQKQQMDLWGIVKTWNELGFSVPYFIINMFTCWEWQEIKGIKELLFIIKLNNIHKRKTNNTLFT